MLNESVNIFEREILDRSSFLSLMLLSTPSKDADINHYFIQLSINKTIFHRSGYAIYLIS